MGYLRRFWIFFVFLFALGGSSCTPTREAVRRIHLPDSAEVTLQQLATDLTQELRIPLSKDEDHLGLYAFVADWIGTPYRFGSNSKRGTDCSGFVYLLYKDVYQIDVGRSSSADLMSQTTTISREELKEGDMVFFNINNRRGGRASHAGVYLKDGKFAHASTRRGVIISSLSEPYYRRTFIGGGRLK